MKRRLGRGVRGVCALVCLAALTGSALAQDRPLRFGIHRMNQHPHYPASRIRPAQPTQGPVLYYGGPVMSNVQVVVVLWTGKVDPGEVANAPGFYSTITTSPFLDMLSEYSTIGLNGQDGQPGSNQTIGHGTFLETVTITPSTANSSIKCSPAVANMTCVSDAQIASELLAQIHAGRLPPPQLDSAG